MAGRKDVLKYVSNKLGRRKLVWGGIRTDDVLSITDLPQLSSSFSIIEGHFGGSILETVAFEDTYGVRMDLDRWDIEDHMETAEVKEFRHKLLVYLAEPTAFLPYRSSGFFSSVIFGRRDMCVDLGRFGVHQELFEHKPWVETNIEDLGVPLVKWKYVADEEWKSVRGIMKDSPVVLRVSRSSGGEGLRKVFQAEDLEESWIASKEGFLAVSPFIENAIPVNVGATVWNNGVTVGYPSVQLIGIPECTTRAFGYCGNDFGAMDVIEDFTLDLIQKSVEKIGYWLSSYHYRGTFGVDFLVGADGVPLFTEINPRFQGSTHASCQLSYERGESCLILDHLAAVLGADRPDRQTVRDLARDAGNLAHVVVHWNGNPKELDCTELYEEFHKNTNCCRVDVQAKSNVIAGTGSVILRNTVRDRLTASGFELMEPWRSMVFGWTSKNIGDVEKQNCEGV